MERAWSKDIKTLIPGMRVVHNRCVLGASGAISSQTKYGLKLTKTGSEVGRYTCQLVGPRDVAQNAEGIANVIVTQEGADDAAATDAKGVWDGLTRDIDVGAGAKDGTFEIQFVDADTRADAEVQDNFILRVTVILIDSKAL